MLKANLNGRSINFSQGKSLGGSSTTNAHAFVPPGKGQADAWEALGNIGWNWDLLKKYLDKAYTFPQVNPSSEKGLGIDGFAAGDHSAGGPLQTSFPGDPAHPVRQAWIETFRSNGYASTSNPFLDPKGAFSCLASIDPTTKERCSAATAYYFPVQSRKNLHVITNATVEKVLFDQVSLEAGPNSKPKATGVQYRHKNKIQIARSQKEVIIAAGALQSPKLLELSGIGNPEILNKYGIPLIHSIDGVGENLHDHLVVGIGYEAVDDLETLDGLVRQEPKVLQKAFQDYQESQAGLLTSIGLYTYAYLPPVENLLGKIPGQESMEELLDQNRPPEGDGPAEVRARAIYTTARKTLLSHDQPSGIYFSVITQNVLPPGSHPNSPTAPIPGKFLTLGTMLSQPLSRGSVHITSGDVADFPAIDPKYASNPVDVEVMAQQLMYLESLAATPSPLSNLLKRPLRHRDPASELTSIDKAKEYVKSSAISMWHPAGTCAMLPRDKDGVLDTNLRVYGVEHLRVVDSSAVPLISIANLQSTVYALAERAADLIKRTYGLH